MTLGYHVVDVKWVRSDDHTNSVAAFDHLVEHIKAELPGWQPWGNPVFESIGGDRVYAQLMVKWAWGLY